MKPWYRNAWTLAGMAALAGGLAWAFRPRPAEIDVGRVTRGALVVAVEEEGRTRIRQSYVVSAPLAGRLSRVTLRPGDAVEAGRTMIAAIEPATPGLLDVRERAQAEARLKAAMAARARAESQLERARTVHRYAEVELERARGLHAGGGVSHQELDTTERREAETAAELKTAGFEGRIADYEAEIAKASLLGAASAEEGTEWSVEITAPVSGRVLRVFQESATVVAAGARLVEVGDPAEIEIVIEALSTDAVKIVPGARVEIEHWGGDRPLGARVRTVEPAGFTKVSALGVEEQRVNVIADFTGPAGARGALGDGFRVEARVVIWENADAIQLPVGALFRAGEGWAVFVVEAGRARLRPVEIGRRNRREAEVIGGARVGEEVVVHPGDRVRDGGRVKAR